jgi:signal transduction histidine kinase
MFVALRGLHAEATSSSLADIAQTLAVRIRGAVADRNVAAVISQVRSEVSGTGVTVQLLMSDGSVVELGPVDPKPSAGIPIPADARVGDTLTGTVDYSDGNAHDYAALVLRGANATAPRAVLLSSVDRSGADALRDVTRTLPIVIVVTLLVGAPLALVLSRSVARPIARVAARTNALSDPSTAPLEPLPLAGPREVRELTDRVNVLAVELARARARESELLANLRHDLRTPLTVIGGFAQALADGTATGPDAERAAAAILEETGRLERLVGELGATDRLRTGTDTLHLEPLDPSTVLLATAQRFAAEARAAGIELTVAGADPADGLAVAALAADRLALDRILGNLVDNALAVLGPGGHVRLEARTVAAVPGGVGPAVAFSVVDDGPGFPPGGIDVAFERFYRGDPARSGPGSGLGLAIVRELARAHGGIAIAENLAPHGARVSVVLPVRPPNPAATEASAAEASAAEAFDSRLSSRSAAESGPSD